MVVSVGWVERRKTRALVYTESSALRCPIRVGGIAKPNNPSAVDINFSVKRAGFSKENGRYT